MGFEYREWRALGQRDVQGEITKYKRDRRRDACTQCDT